MLGNYNASPKVTAHEEKKEMSNISKENNDMTPPNGSFTDDKNSEEKESMIEFRKRLHLSNEQFDEFVKFISQKNPFNLCE